MKQQPLPAFVGVNNSSSFMAFIQAKPAIQTSFVHIFSMFNVAFSRHTICWRGLGRELGWLLVLCKLPLEVTPLIDTSQKFPKMRYYFLSKKKKKQVSRLYLFYLKEQLGKSNALLVPLYVYRSCSDARLPDSPTPPNSKGKTPGLSASSLSNVQRLSVSKFRGVRVSSRTCVCPSERALVISYNQRTQQARWFHDPGTAFHQREGLAVFPGLNVRIAYEKRSFITSSKGFSKPNENYA